MPTAEDLTQAVFEAGSVPCQQAPDLFFPDGPDQSVSLRKWAVKACMSCPVRRVCLEYSLEHEEEHGIWGGVTPNERKAILKSRRRAAAACA